MPYIWRSAHKQWKNRARNSVRKSFEEMGDGNKLISPHQIGINEWISATKLHVIITFWWFHALQFVQLLLV